MDLQIRSLIEALVRDEDRVTRERIEECARRGAAMVEALADVVGEAADWDAHFNDPDEDGWWWLRHHAAHILGLMEDEAAGMLLVDLMRWLANAADDELVEWLSGKWPVFFRNKPASVLRALEALAFEYHDEPWLRPEMLLVLLKLAAQAGALERELDKIAEWLQGPDHDPLARSVAASVLLEFPREAYRPLLESVATEGAAAERTFDLNEVEWSFAHRESRDLAIDTDVWAFYSPAEIEQRQQRWAQEDAEFAASYGGEFDGMDETDFLVEEPYRRELPKVGRNEPCPCGSGRKFKKCCLGTEQLGLLE